jgi:hypothetical protein
MGTVCGGGGIAPLLEAGRAAGHRKARSRPPQKRGWSKSRVSAGADKPLARPAGGQGMGSPRRGALPTGFFSCGRGTAGRAGTALCARNAPHPPYPPECSQEESMFLSASRTPAALLAPPAISVAGPGHQPRRRRLQARARGARPRAGVTTTTVVGRQVSEYREEDRIGDYDQPRWTARRLFPSTRVYCAPAGSVGSSTGPASRCRSDEGKTTVETQYEVEFGLPHRFQIEPLRRDREDRQRGRAQLLASRRPRSATRSRTGARSG